MKCPACGNLLNPIQAGGITVDVCAGGCGGIWFDAFELQKMDEMNEPVPADILSLQKDAAAKIISTAKRHCPKCEEFIMRQHFYSAEKGVMVDSCPNCGGYWLDAGELDQIRHEKEILKERKQATGARLAGLKVQALSQNLPRCQEDAQNDPALLRAMSAMSRTTESVARSLPPM